MNCYQKFYTNQIHSSSLLCQLATMWKSQVLCDAIIRSGSVVTKAHRVVLVAACPMLQSMENAAVGSHLEVRLAADIKQESIQTFLQYLYEGFMMLTEQNCRDVEKIARLLQVDNVIKCCADFNKCLSSKTGHMSANDQYKYTFHDMVEFKHVRSSEMQKTVQERTTKRTSDFPQPPSPGNKRQRTQDMHADDAASMASSYSHVAPDPWDRVPKLGMPFHARGGQGSQQPGVIDIVEDSLELIQTDPPDSSGDRSNKDQRLSQKSVSIAVASKISNNTNLQIVDVATEQARPEPRSRNSMPLHSRVAPANQTLTSTENGKSTNSHPAPKASSHSTTPVMNDKLQVSSSPGMSPSSPHFSNRSSPQVRPEPSTHKPFAAGSESQSSQPPQQNTDLSSNTNAAESISDTGTSNARETQEANQQKPSKPPSPEKTSTDLTIVKIESDDEEAAAMEMYINVAGGGAEAIRVQRAEHGDLEEGDPQAEWMREDVSNEDSNVSGDQSNSWVYPPGGPAQYKGVDMMDDRWTGPTTNDSDLPLLVTLRNIAASFVIKNVGLPHRAVSTHMQRTCFVCKQFGRRIQSNISGFDNRMKRICRSSYKCECCDVSLCIGDRMCFQQFHEMLRTTQNPNLFWENPHRNALLPHTLL
ncbi:transcription regulator protein BACH1-like isoform X6 [Saccostrea echinata]|uniref:transcription regulator protein BACH1-like isoform X6 n=1 Tax=Saccostrea echinata TaxID=191078 RepID=UPI002A81A8C0|nr:transcription regulator protein BACH1-like isoform X6 [Saccostrea echinata]